MLYLSRATFLLVVLLLSACAGDPLLDTHTGPTATLTDLIVPTGGNSVDIFYASAFNGQSIRNSRGATASASSGLGPVIRATNVRRRVPAEQVVVTIVGERHYAAPIIAMFNEAYRISGDVTFIPQTGALYRVRGLLLPTSVSVWIEDAATGKPVGATLRQERDWEPPSGPVPGTQRAVP